MKNKKINKKRNRLVAFLLKVTNLKIGAMTENTRIFNFQPNQMNKMFFGMIFLFCSIGSIVAQNDNIDYRNKFSLGGKIGTNLSNVYDAQDQTFHADSKFGLVAGGFLSIPLGNFFGVQPEVLFSQKGFKATGNLLGSGYTLTRTTTFIDIPLMFTIKPIGMVTIMAGPQFSYLIKQRDVISNSTNSYAQEKEFQNENVRKNILCFIGGADINLKQLVIGVRAGWDLQNNNGNGTSSTPRYKNVWYQATLGFRI